MSIVAYSILSMVQTGIHTALISTAEQGVIMRAYFPCPRLAGLDTYMTL